MNDFVIQTAASNELAGALKAHAALRNVLMFDVFAEAMEHFIAHRMTLQKRRQSVPYLISPKKARPLNVRIPTKLAKQLQTLADEDEVPARRLVYTALVHYAVSQQLISSVGTIESGVVDLDKKKPAENIRSIRKRSSQ